MSEIWKWVKMVKDDIEYDYTNMYRIYIDGRVESVKRKRVKQNSFLKERTYKKGYKLVSLSKDGKKKMYLRWCSNATNNRNCTHKRPKHDLPRGVCITKYGKYQARIMINGKNKSLGNYKTKEEASIIYEEARREQINKEQFID